jgi:hypothetical protein
VDVGEPSRLRVARRSLFLTATSPPTPRTAALSALTVVIRMVANCARHSFSHRGSGYGSSTTLGPSRRPQTHISHPGAQGSVQFSPGIAATCASGTQTSAVAATAKPAATRRTSAISLTSRPETPGGSPRLRAARPVAYCYRYQSADPDNRCAQRGHSNDLDGR